jgi:hypothetical protein
MGLSDGNTSSHHEALCPCAGRSAAANAGAGGSGQSPAARSLRPLQRPAERERQARVLAAWCKLVQPHDCERQPANNGLARRMLMPARHGAVHLHRPALGHQVQLQLPVVNDKPKCEGRCVSSVGLPPPSIPSLIVISIRHAVRLRPPIIPYPCSGMGDVANP